MSDFPMVRVSRRQIDVLLLNHDWRHLKPILRAVRDHKIGLVMMLSGGDRVDLCRMLKRPSVIIIGDDAGFAFGPVGFDPDMLQVAFTAAELVITVDGAPYPACYERAAAFAARKRRHAVIVETRPEYAAEWADVAARYAVTGAA